MDEKELRQDAATLKKQKTRQYMREYYLRHRGPPGQRNSRWPQEVNDLLAEEYKKNKTPISMDFDRLSIETGKTQRQVSEEIHFQNSSTFSLSDQAVVLAA